MENKKLKVTVTYTCRCPEDKRVKETTKQVWILSLDNEKRKKGDGTGIHADITQILPFKRGNMGHDFRWSLSSIDKSEVGQYISKYLLTVFDGEDGFWELVKFSIQF